MREGVSGVLEVLEVRGGPGWRCEAMRATNKASRGIGAGCSAMAMAMAMRRLAQEKRNETYGLSA